MSDHMLRAEKMIKDTIQNLLQKPDYAHTNQFLRTNFASCSYPGETGSIKNELIRLSDENDYVMYVLLNMAWGNGLFEMWACMNPHSKTNMFDNFCDEIDAQGFSDLWRDMKRDHIKYDQLISSCDITLKKEADFNLIIPVKNRFPHLETFLKWVAQYNSLLENWSITIIFQEDDKKFYEEIKAMNIEYVNIIHLPHDALDGRYEDNMNRSLCYNVASKIVRCKWQINHDVDLIMAPDFFNHVEEKSKNRKKWFQPYRGSRVIYLSEDASNKLKMSLDSNSHIEVEAKFPPLNATPNSPGAPGGSVVVNWEDFQEMGGYDPELIFGYAPEDHMFWRKLEGFYDEEDSDLLKPRKMSAHPFYSDDVFSHDSSVELVHLWHPPTLGSKKYPYFNFFFAHYITNKFLKSDQADWIKLSQESYGS